MMYMKRRSITALFAFIILAVLSCYSPNFAQARARAADMFAGETIVYEGKINKIIRGITVAELTFKTTKAESGDSLLISAEAVSKGTLLKLFRYSFLQQYDSTIDLNRFRIIRSKKHDVQKERVRDSEAEFDYNDKRVRFTETDPKDPNRPPRRIASEIGDQTQDLVSAIYSMRLADLSVGKKFEVSISDSGLVYEVPVQVTGKSVEKTEIGKVNCFLVEPQIFGKGRLIEQEGSLKIWITDDARHLPVRAIVNAKIGKIEIKIKSVSKSA